MEKVNELQKSLLFRDLALPELKKLAAICHEHFYRAGEQLFAQGDVADELLLITVGSVRVAKELSPTEDDDNVITLGSGSYFGEMAAVEGNEIRPVSVFTIEKTYVLGINTKELTQLCDSDPVLGYHVYRAMTKAFARRIHRLIGDTAYHHIHAFDH